MVCPPATSETGARRPRSISNYWALCQTRKTPTLTAVQHFKNSRSPSSTLEVRQRSRHTATACYCRSVLWSLAIQTPPATADQPVISTELKQDWNSFQSLIRERWTYKTYSQLTFGQYYGTLFRSIRDFGTLFRSIHDYGTLFCSIHADRGRQYHFVFDIISYQYHGQKNDIISCIYHLKKVILYHIISYIILIFTKLELVD
jgi:hypothetical protein